jgi:hypothetical protein
MRSTSRRLPVSLSPARLTAYAAAGAALSGTQSANAAIIYTSVNTLIVDTTINDGAIGFDLLFDGFHLTLAHGVGASNAATGYALADPDGLGSPSVLVAGFVAGAYNYVTKFNTGEAISSAAFLPSGVAGTMGFNGGYSYSQFLAAGISYIGVKFDADRYGWVRVEMNGAPLNSFTILDYAYGGKGEQVLVGQVPEPTGISLLALGSAGLASWRRRKTAAA